MGLKIALAGNPNAGKTSLFNRMTGASQKVGNWGGVTVEIKEGNAKVNDEPVTIIDLPGTYSMSTCSLDEAAARSYLLEEKPDVVIDVIDATNLERHLYLTVQLLELGIRPVLALNMWDEVKTKGIEIDIPLLGKLLGVPIMATDGRKGDGVERLLATAVDFGHQKQTVFENKVQLKLPKEIEKAIDTLSDHVGTFYNGNNPRWIAMQLLEHDKAVEIMFSQIKNDRSVLDLRDTIDKQIASLFGETPEGFIAEARYGFIAGAVKESVKVEVKINRIEFSEKIDSVLTHRFWAYPIFLLFLWLLFQATFKLGQFPMHLIELVFSWLNSIASHSLPAGVIRDLLTDGIIAGIGGVIVFLPNILILFFGISIMEDTGYMARTAFIMDKLMHRIGLHGKSFIPMIMGLGCSVPAIMAARTLESKPDRIKTILLTPLISCSARLPVFVLFAGTFFPNHAGNIVFLFQVVLGFSAFICMAILFKHTLFTNSEDYPFVMELPPYRLPTFRSILIHMWHKTEHYLKKMGGVVLLFSVALWWLGAYPKSRGIEEKYSIEIESIKNDKTMSDDGKKTALVKCENEKHASVMEHTYIGTIGKMLEPLVKPFGTDWRGAVSLATGFVAKEIVVGSMGVLYAAGNDHSDNKQGLRQKLQKVYTPLSAFAFMLFVLLYTPCMVALVTAMRELKDWKWSVFSVSYQLALAWICATAVFQIGTLLRL